MILASSSFSGQQLRCYSLDHCFELRTVFILQTIIGHLSQKCEKHKGVCVYPRCCNSSAEDVLFHVESVCSVCMWCTSFLSLVPDEWWLAVISMQSVMRIRSVVRLMFLNDSHTKHDWLDVDSKSQQATENNKAGRQCSAIKDISPWECHYLSTSIYVQMAPNLLLPTTTDTVCGWRRSHSKGTCCALFKQINPIPL